jgi:hypothetical protein
MKFRSIIFVSFALLSLAGTAEAEVRVSPAVIDEKAHARDILKEAITLRNEGPGQVRLYPVVNNLTADGKQDFRSPTEADQERSLANWIQFPRGGLTLEPGEIRRIEFEIRVSLAAKPDRYHAVIAFPAGSDRASAEASVLGAPSAAVNLEVAEVVKENLQLKRFFPVRRAFWQGPVALRIVLENLGTRPETPRGDVIVYDKTGAEVASIPVNQEHAVIAPGAAAEYEVPWNARTLGQYKALLSLAYGSSDAVQIQDTVFFWFLPWQKVAAGAAAAIMLFIAFMSFLHARVTRHAPIPAGTRGVLGHLKSDGIPHVVDLRHPSSHDHA